MKGKLLLAESGTTHPDNTFSVLRAGINQVVGNGPTFPFSGVLVAMILSDIGDQGDHQFDIRCMNQDGAMTMPPLQGQFASPPTGGTNFIVLGLGIAFPARGRHGFYLRIDNVEHDNWMINVVQSVPPVEGRFNETEQEGEDDPTTEE